MLAIVFVLLSIEIQEFGLFLEYEDAVEDIAEEPDRDGRDGTCEIVVDMAFFEEPNSKTIAYPTDDIHQDKLENQFLVLLFINQGTIGGEIEGNTDDVA